MSPRRPYHLSRPLRARARRNTRGPTPGRYRPSPPGNLADRRLARHARGDCGAQIPICPCRWGQ
eukprot:11211403-Lingulodinium_polyedra.AAC.1